MLVATTCVPGSVADLPTCSPKEPGRCGQGRSADGGGIHPRHAPGGHGEGRTAAAPRASRGPGAPLRQVDGRRPWPIGESGRAVNRALEKIETTLCWGEKKSAFLKLVLLAEGYAERQDQRPAR